MFTSETMIYISLLCFEVFVLSYANKLFAMRVASIFSCNSQQGNWDAGKDLDSSAVTVKKVISIRTVTALCSVSNKTEENLTVNHVLLVERTL